MFRTLDIFNILRPTEKIFTASKQQINPNKKLKTEPICDGLLLGL